MVFNLKKIGKQISNKTNKTITNIGNSTNQAIKQVENNANIVGNRFNKTVKTILGGRQGFSPQILSFLESNQEQIINQITIIRTPIEKAIKSILDVFGGANNYDNLFHLRIQILCENGLKFTLEKNEVIKLGEWRKDNLDEILQINKNFNVSIVDFLNNAIQGAGKGRFYSYSTSNNCQAFIQMLLINNNVDDNNIISFVKQDTESVFKNNPNLRKFSNSITGIGKIAANIMDGGSFKQGGSIKKAKPNKWITFVKEYQNKHNISYKQALSEASYHYN